MISREQYLNRYSLITKLLASVYFMRKPTYFARRSNVSFQEGKMAFLAYDDITQKIWGQYSLLLVLYEKNIERIIHFSTQS